MPAIELVTTPEGVEVEAAVGGGSAAEQQKRLLQTAASLDQDVVLPLYDLYQAIKMYAQLVQDRHHMQQVAVRGDEPRGEGGQHTSASMAARGVHSPAGRIAPEGLQGVLAELADEHSSLQQRVRSIQQRYAVVHEHAERCLHLVQLLRKGVHRVSAGEKLYRAQLQLWSKRVQDMTREMEQLKVQARRVGMAAAAAARQGQGEGQGMMSPAAAGGLTSPTKLALTSSQESRTTPIRTPFLARRGLLPPQQQQQLMSTAARGGQKDKSPLPTPDPTPTHTGQPTGDIVLNEEDTTLCMQILKEQGDKLHHFQKQVQLLEKRVYEAHHQAVPIANGQR